MSALPVMMQAVEPAYNSRRSLGLHTHVTDTVSEWKELYDANMRSFINACSMLHPDAPKPPHPTQDCIRARTLRVLIRDFYVSFTDWCAEEVLAFAFCACPLENLKIATEAGNTLEFLSVLHRNWDPLFLDWAYFLWEFTGRACELFADVLFLMPKEQKPDKTVLGKVLFMDMVNLNLVPPAACASFIGALVPHPRESTYARKHEEVIESYSKLLRPQEIGLICRSLVLYRSRDYATCECGYNRGEFECTCMKKQQELNPIEVPWDPLAFDLDKEYAAILMSLILSRNGIQVLEDELRWTREERDEFIRSACEVVFSEAIYTEIYQNLNHGELPRLKQRFPRKITDSERRSNMTRNFDNDYDYSTANHAGCVARACKQSMKKDCANMSCRQHCTRHGRLICKEHRNYSVKPLSAETERKRIFRRDERQNSGGGFTHEREGENI